MTYTTITPRHISNEYTDIDELLVHINFELLLKFLEENEQSDIVDWTESKINDKSVIDIMCDLSDWYLTQYLPYFNGSTREQFFNGLDEPEMNSEPLEIDSEFYRLVFKYNSPEHEIEYDKRIKEWIQFESDFHYETQQKLHLLIDCRPFMWI